MMPSIQGRCLLRCFILLFQLLNSPRVPVNPWRDQLLVITFTTSGGRLRVTDLMPMHLAGRRGTDIEPSHHLFPAVEGIERQLHSDDLRHFAGVGRRLSVSAAVLTCCVLSRAGFPPFGGYVGKTMLFGAALGVG
jgi:hypothetical protein